MDKRYKFPATCPYCNNQSDWLFSANETGQHFVDCEHCGRTYAISIDVEPKTTGVFALVPPKFVDGEKIILKK